VVTIKKSFQNADGVDERYLVAFAADAAGYCPVQFFGGWIKASVLSDGIK